MKKIYFLSLLLVLVVIGYIKWGEKPGEVNEVCSQSFTECMAMDRSASSSAIEKLGNTDDSGKIAYTLSSAQNKRDVSCEATHEEESVAVESLRFVGQTHDVRVEVTADENVFPQGAEMRLSPVSKSATLAAAQLKCDEEDSLVDAVAVDITFWLNGQEIQPNGLVEVRLLANREIEGDTHEAVTINHQGVTEVVGQANASMSAFTTNHFTVYAIVGKTYGGRNMVKYARQVYSFYLNDELISRQIVKNGDVLFEPATPAGYTNKVFEGWFVGESDTPVVFGTVNIPTEQTVNDTFRVDARFTDMYKVSFYADAQASVIRDIKLAKDQERVISSDVSLEDSLYKLFLGWVDSATTTPITGDNVIIDKQNIGLLPKYDDFVGVYFESLGGTAVPMQKLVIGSKATQPADPTFDGYVFQGWYDSYDPATDTYGSTRYDFKSDVVTNTILYAKWQPKKNYYKIRIWQENADDEDYTLYDSLYLIGDVGEEIAVNTLLSTVLPKDKYDGFHLNGTALPTWINNISNFSQQFDYHAPYAIYDEYGYYSHDSTNVYLFYIDAEGDTIYPIDYNGDTIRTFSYFDAGAYIDDRAAFIVEQQGTGGYVFVDTIGGTIQKGRSNGDISIHGDGSTVVNVYYSRDTYRFLFRFGSSKREDETNYETNCSGNKDNTRMADSKTWRLSNFGRKIDGLHVNPQHATADSLQNGWPYRYTDLYNTAMSVKFGENLYRAINGLNSNRRSSTDQPQVTKAKVTYFIDDKDWAWYAAWKEDDRLNTYDLSPESYMFEVNPTEQNQVLFDGNFLKNADGSPVYPHGSEVQMVLRRIDKDNYVYPWQREQFVHRYSYYYEALPDGVSGVMSDNYNDNVVFPISPFDKSINGTNYKFGNRYDKLVWGTYWYGETAWLNLPQKGFTTIYVQDYKNGNPPVQLQGSSSNGEPQLWKYFSRDYNWETPQAHINWGNSTLVDGDNRVSPPVRFYNIRNQYNVKFIDNQNVVLDKNLYYEQYLNLAGEDSLHTLATNQVKGLEGIVVKPDGKITKKVNGVSYKFDGWYADSLGESAAEYPEVMPYQDLTYYSKWVADSCDVTFHFQNGDPDVTITVQYNRPFPADKMPSQPTWNNHEFFGYMDDSDFQFNFDGLMRKDTNVYAQWTESVTYAVQYDAGTAGTFALIADPCRYMEGAHAATLGMAKPNVATDTVFIGWRVGESNTILTSGLFDVNVTNDVADGTQDSVITLKAVYAPVPRYVTSVTYHANYPVRAAGEDYEVKGQTVNDDYVISEDADSRNYAAENYAFFGWSSVSEPRVCDVTDANRVIFQKGDTIALEADDNHLYAVWTPTYYFEENVVICENELPYSWHSKSLAEAGEHWDSLKTVAGADSVFKLVLTFNPTPAVRLNSSVEICPNVGDVVLTATLVNASLPDYTYQWRGALVPASTSTSADGMSETATFTIPSAYCDTIYRDTVEVTDGNGCKAQAEAEIIVKDVVPPTLSVASENDPKGACNPDIIEPTFAVSDHCAGDFLLPADSVSVGEVVNTSSCGRSQTWTAHYTNSCGHSAADLSVTYTWSVETKGFEEMSVCDSVTINGTTYTESAVISYNLANQNACGCDSLVTINLIVNKSATGDTTAVETGRFTWHGVTYTHTPEIAPTHNYQTVYGCDSVVTLHLTILPDSVDIHVSKIWDDHHDNDGYRPTSVTLNLTANSALVASRTLTGTGYEWEADFGRHPIKQEGSNDSIRYLIEEEIFENADLYLLPEVSLQETEESGVYKFRVTNAHKLDSVDLTVVKKWLDNTNTINLRKPVNMQLFRFNGSDDAAFNPEHISAAGNASWAPVGEPLTVGTADMATVTWTKLPKYNNGVRIRYAFKELDSPDSYTTTYVYGGELTEEHDFTDTVVNRHLEPAVCRGLLPVHKNLSGRQWLSSDRFVIALIPDKPDYPMPASVTTVEDIVYAPLTITSGSTFVSDSVRKGVFPPITFTMDNMKNATSKQFTYHVRELTSAETGLPSIVGMTYSTERYEVTITVSTGTDNNLMIEDVSFYSVVSHDNQEVRKEQVETPVITNRYADSTTIYRLVAKKQLTIVDLDETLETGEFEFVLRPVGSNAAIAPMPKNTVGEGESRTLTVTNTGNAIRFYDDSQTDDGLLFNYLALSEHFSDQQLYEGVTFEYEMHEILPTDAVYNREVPGTFIRTVKNSDDISVEEIYDAVVHFREISVWMEKQSGKAVLHVVGDVDGHLNDYYVNGEGSTVYLKPGTSAYNHRHGIDGVPIFHNSRIALTNIMVEKAWDDFYNALSTRPASINVILLADGRASGHTVELDEANGWKHTFQDLPTITAAGDRIAYSVQEIAVPHYTTMCWGDKEEGFTILNSLTSYGDDEQCAIIVDRSQLNEHPEAPCPSSVTDADGISYETVVIVGYCWMKENLRTETAGSMVYQSAMYPDVDANLQTFGRLYTWHAAAGGTDNPERVDGYVRGVCPNGWHLPTLAEINVLRTHAAEALYDDSKWMSTGDNTSGFNALPAGMFNADAQRFESLGAHTYFHGDTPATAFGIEYYCCRIVPDISNSANAYSVRCVKDIE